jgi:hypothetical protein
MPNVVNNNYSSNFEPLPNTSRTLNFRLVARDLVSPYAGYAYDNIAVNVDGTKGPLTVTAPNTNVSINAGSNYTVTWSVNNTNSICNSMNILLSLDGGFTYSHTLLTNTNNDGGQSVFFPTVLPASTQARIKVESACLSCLKFFDISNANFTIISSCQIAITNICNADTLEVSVNDPSLNMNLSLSYGSSFISKSMTTAGSAVLSSLHTGTTPQSGGCISINFNDRVATFKFKPTVSGEYSFSMVGGFGHASVYQGDFTSTQVCINFLGSTAYNGGNVSNPINLELTECGVYTVVFFDANNTSGTMTITGPPGSITFLHNQVNNANYSYTFLAVNGIDNIVAVSNTASFIALNQGAYRIYGLQYYSGTSNPPGNVNPNSFIGQSLSSISSSGLCLSLSENHKPVIITSSCSDVVSNGADSGPGSLRNALSCNDSNTIITIDQAVTQITLNSQLVVSKNMTIQGFSNTQRPEIVTFVSGININANRTLTLQNVDIKHIGNNTFNGAGTLNIVGITHGKQ